MPEPALQLFTRLHLCCELPAGTHVAAPWPSAHPPGCSQAPRLTGQLSASLLGCGPAQGFSS